MFRTIGAALLCISTGTVFGQSETAPASNWKVLRSADGWQLLHDGKPFYIQGAVGSKRLDLLRACGGNAIRTRADRESLDEAQQYGLAAMVNLPVRGQRSGIDWGDDAQVARQQQQVLRIVRILKDHPAVMFWAIGNELDYIPGGVPHHPRLWQRLNSLAAAIRQVDPGHPVLTVVGSGHFDNKIREIASSCKNLDLLGINTYGDIAEVTKSARTNWPKPYVLAEWGPTGHWQVPKTAWHAPLEQTSTQKAHVIDQRYRTVILADREHCLGSFVFYWSEKQETTHTWYGLFRGGLRTESMDVMQHHWSGHWGENRAPEIGELQIDGFPDRRDVRLRPGQTYRATIGVSDPEGDTLQFTWDIRPEVTIPAGSYAGSMEKRAVTIDGLIPDATVPRPTFTAPKKGGPYRLFVNITDGHGNAAYGNVPFLVTND